MSPTGDGEQPGNRRGPGPAAAIWHLFHQSEQLLRQILESGAVVGRDGAGRTLLQLAVDRATLDRLMAFGADAAESEENGDDEPSYDAPPVHTCWFEAA